MVNTTCLKVNSQFFLVKIPFLHGKIGKHHIFSWPHPGFSLLSETGRLPHQGRQGGIRTGPGRLGRRPGRPGIWLVGYSGYIYINIYIHIYILNIYSGIIIMGYIMVGKKDILWLVGYRYIHIYIQLYNYIGNIIILILGLLERYSGLINLV